jgi:hypothetical protein
MQYVVERNENITAERARGTAWAVRDLDGTLVGTISHGEAGWRVFSAGWGVTVDHNQVYRARDLVINAVVEARLAASQPGGPLAVEHGLTGHQRAMIDFQRKYAMVTDPAKIRRVIWEQFDMSPTQFFHVWNALIDHPAALEYDPHVINRHHRLRAERKAKRTRVTVPA